MLLPVKSILTCLVFKFLNGTAGNALTSLSLALVVHAQDLTCWTAQGVYSLLRCYQ